MVIVFQRSFRVFPFLFPIQSRKRTVCSPNQKFTMQTNTTFRRNDCKHSLFSPNNFEYLGNGSISFHIHSLNSKNIFDRSFPFLKNSSIQFPFYPPLKLNKNANLLRTFSSSNTSENSSIEKKNNFKFNSIENTLKIIIDKLNSNGIFLDDYNFGDYRIICPKCGGGSTQEYCFSLSIKLDIVQWNCFRGKCGFRGGFNLDSTSSISSQSKSKSKSNFVVSPSDNNFDMNNMMMSNNNNVNNINNINSNLYQEIKLELKELDEQLIQYFKLRGISEQTLQENKISKIYAHPPYIKKDESASIPPAIAFPYFRKFKQKNILIHCKFRTEGKQFWQTKGTKKYFYGLNDIENAKEIVIVEGEIDKLSLYEVGIKNCVSVPNGAPSKLKNKLPAPENDKSFSYIWSCREYLQDVEKIIIATDADKPGQVLAEELARRLGKERCYKVVWPEYKGGVCKDANEVLLKFGKEKLINLISSSIPYPVNGLFHFSDYFTKIDGKYDHYFNENDNKNDNNDAKNNIYNSFYLENASLVSTGWKILDNYYKVSLNELTVICGLSNAGKSEFINSLIININLNYNWKFALCYLENQVGDIGIQFLEKFYKKPFFKSNASPTQSFINREELERGISWLDQNFHFIRSDDRSPPSIDWVLDVAKSAVQISGINGLVIDSFAQFDHLRPPHLSESEYASYILSKLKQFALMNSCHVWIVTNSKKLHTFESENFDILDVVENAQFANKPDNCIVINRELNYMNSNRNTNNFNNNNNTSSIMKHENGVEVIVKKIRNKSVGRTGIVRLDYDRLTGKYLEPALPSPNSTRKF